jgi:hypothetical protein
MPQETLFSLGSVEEDISDVRMPQEERLKIVWDDRGLLNVRIQTAIPDA